VIAPNFVHHDLSGSHLWICETCGTCALREPSQRQQRAHAAARDHRYAALLTERARAGWVMLPGTVERHAIEAGVEHERADEEGFPGCAFVRLDVMEDLEDRWRSGASAPRLAKIRAAAEIVRATGLPWRLAWHQVLDGRPGPKWYGPLAGGRVWPWESSVPARRAA
jgi:hypothetical protein